METAIWIVQGLLAVAFLMFGVIKALNPKEKLAERMAWVEDFDAPVIKIIGVLEILAAIGLIVPMVVNILPVLTPLAAIGLVVTMIGATFTQFRHQNMPQVGLALALVLLSAFVAYGRIDLLIG